MNTSAPKPSGGKAAHTSKPPSAPRSSEVMMGGFYGLQRR